MKKCSSCNIEFNIKGNTCPLCQNKLTGENTNLTFPNNTWYESKKLTLKIILFI